MAQLDSEMLSSFGFRWKQVSASLTSAPTCPLLKRLPFLVSTEPNFWRSLPSVTTWSILDHIQEVRRHSNFAAPSKAYQEYKASYHIVYLTTRHVSSNMQSCPHDDSLSYSYQCHHQTSMSPTPPSNCVDHGGHHSTSGQPMGYHLPGDFFPNSTARPQHNHHVFHNAGVSLVLLDNFPFASARISVHDVL